MTGFGKASLQLPTKKITVEVKSLNSKSLDLNVRLPQTYREKELPLRNIIAQELERGKVDFSLFCEITAEETSNKINGPIVLSYINQMKEIIPNGDATELMKMAVRMPDALKVERVELDENEWTEIEKVIKEAISNMKEFRISEGGSLEADFRKRVANIREYMNEVAVLDSERILTVKERLRSNLAELQLTIDENRFEQEVIYYLEKMDITEEKVRLSKHLDYFIETLEGAEANGRKLGFIAQEMGREINTMGSKSNHAEMQKFVVRMKDELEKIKEQVLNVL
ncbi:YicC/YloC family endoribonuclease [Myroides phaeus]|uniref:TIGR00255 family protein n=1 Tax=Myroides phaeus TaxID=702745 RepID=A0A1G8B1J9_9FLAO|nr:YicC/YloC family endoribonuclease [Myroides phaeus]MEC4115792.1 YicC/YloC family endoribonuclease [Myroides phaeus]SDH27067.1 TIGR00255 family protein [Myroides phaeus]